MSLKKLSREDGSYGVKTEGIFVRLPGFMKIQKFRFISVGKQKFPLRCVTFHVFSSHQLSATGLRFSVGVPRSNGETFALVLGDHIFIYPLFSFSLR